MWNEIHQQAIVGHVVFQVWVRPVCAPEHAIGEFIDDAFGKGNDIAVRILLAVQGIRAANA